MMSKKELEDFIIVKSDVKNLCKSVDNIVPKIEEIHDTFIKGEGKITVLNKEVFGNGKPGLRKELSDLRVLVERKFAYYAGGISVGAIIFTIIVQIVIKRIGG